MLNGWLAAEGFAPLDTAHVLDGARPRSRGRAGRGLLRRGARERPRRPHSRRRGAQLLHRHRERDAGGARVARAAESAVRRAVRDGRRHRARRLPAASSASPSASRRSSASSSSTIRKSDAPGMIIEDWDDELEELSPARSDAWRGGRLGGPRHVPRRRAGDAREPRHRNRHAGGVVPREDATSDGNSS